ncbi:hypothetical protein JF540_27810 [Salipiger thiooxidans]|uniref:hypothetical protein n=1 Tax=Salipiger thiooxidans TaxID=282683 RepID=UPI001A902803|nr:hypothetical protein [Salipiger thiooxidans]MBN8190437.1 hypothetical protein [Salipiger thiooxidans]
MSRDPKKISQFAPGMLVVIRAFDDIPEHQFEIQEVYEDCVGGYSRTGPLSGEYGEPDFEMILRVVR